MPTPPEGILFHNLYLGGIALALGSCAVAAWIIGLALLNGALGFAAAVELGRRHRRRCAEAPQAETSEQASGEAADLSLTTSDILAAIVPATDPRREGTSADRPPTVEKAGGASFAPPRSGEPASGESPCGAAVHGLREASRHYQSQLMEVDRRLRDPSTDDPSVVADCAATLRKAGDEYLDHQRASGEAFDAAYSGRSDLSGVRDQVRSALETDVSQIRQAAKTLESPDLEGGVGESRQHVLAETARLLSANDRLQEVLDAALVETARSENRLDAPWAEDQADVPGTLTSRTGLERQLARLWQDHPQHAPPLAVAAIDLDQFGRINEHFGRELGDRILRAVATLVSAEGPEQAISARFSGQRFVLAFPDGDLGRAVSAVERIRQVLEKAHFRRNEFDLQVTVSCGIAAAAAPEDTSKTVCERAEAAMLEAKRYGRNRTFIHEGRYPTPVAPPNLVVPEKVVDL